MKDNSKRYKFIIIGIVIFVLLVPVTYLVYYKLIAKSKRQTLALVVIPEGVKADSIVVYKSKRIMILFDNERVIKDYNVSLGKNPDGRKEKEGDKKTPEGLYKIDYRNPDSKYYLSLHISYPDENDKLKAVALGLNPGSDIMIHGLPNSMGFLKEYFINNDWTDGCIAVTNEEIEEIWRVVNDGIPIMINP